MIGRFSGEGVAETAAMLFGHRTYDDLLGHWTSVDEPNPFTEVLVSKQKYVVSRDSGTTLGYPNSTLLAGDAVETVRPSQAGGRRCGHHSRQRRACESPPSRRPIDEYLLLIHPIVLGSGTRLFGDGDRTNLTLATAEASRTGVVLTRYLAS